MIIAKLKQLMRDGDALFKFTRSVWRYCCVAGYCLLCIYFSILRSHEILHNLSSEEHLKYVYLNLFTTKFVTDTTTYSYTNWFFVCIAVSILAGLFLCAICLFLGQRTTNTNSDSQN